LASSGNEHDGRSTPSNLRSDALRIWQAGVAGVRADRLMDATLRVEGSTLVVGDDSLDLNSVRRIVVVGAGKAGAGMAAALEQILGPRLMEAKQLTGWINVPADCVQTLTRIHLHAARPAGRNEPTAEGVQGTSEILRLVESLGPADLCLCLLSGGGSALLPAPVSAVTLADKLAITRHLSGAGADIRQLNAVRKRLSRLKGGGLARACRAGRLISLIISDVMGDPLDVIASGPTVPDTATAADALAVLAKSRAREAGIAPRVFDYLQAQANEPPPTPPTCQVTNLVIGNNATAVDAAGVEAERLGYSHAMHSARDDGTAEEVGQKLAAMAVSMRGRPGPNCLISGGEPVVRLIDEARRGLGGRNQQLVLASLVELNRDAEGIVILSGGTDGEDGPTDAAGALMDAQVIAAAEAATA
jgi:hydroxypyruvate reductase